MSKREDLRIDLETLRQIKDPKERESFAWELVVRNPRLTYFVARKVFFHADEDALSEARIALHRAMLYVDPDKGSVIKVALWFCLRSRETEHGIHVSKNVEEKVRAWVGRGKDVLDPALDLGGLTNEERQRVAWLVHPWKRELESRTDDDDPLGDLSVEPYEDGTDLDQLHSFLAGMSALSRDALLSGLDEGSTLRTVGKIHGLSGERIRQIRNQYMRRLRDFFCRTSGGEPPDTLDTA
jgi:hypothetical protein